MRARKTLPVVKTLPLLLTLLLAVAGAAAQAQAPDLEAAIETIYTVTAAPGGIALEPLEPRYGVESITLAGDTIRVNGAKVTAEVLRAWVGEQDADLLLQLAELSPAEQRRLFGLDPAGLAEEQPVEEPEGAGELEAQEAPEVEAPEVEAPELEAPGVEAPAPPSPPTPPSPPRPVERPAVYRTGSQFTMFNDLTVSAEESAQEAVAVFGSVRVEGDVRGDVSAIFGSVWVDGRVDGEVVSVFGSVYLGSEAEVLRGATAVGGEVEQEQGAIVRGAVTEVPLAGMPRVDHEWPDRTWHWRGPSWTYHGGWGGVWSLFWRLINLAVLALFLCLTVLLAPRVVARVAERSAGEWWKAGIAGLLALLLYVPAVLLICLVLIITIIGCALVPFVAIAAVLLPLVAFLVGYAGISVCVGRWLTDRFGWGWTSPYAQLLAGFALLEVLRFVGGLATLAGGGIAPFGWMLLGMGNVVRFVAILIGIGAWLLNRFERPAPGTLPALPAAEGPEGGEGSPAA